MAWTHTHSAAAAVAALCIAYLAFSTGGGRPPVAVGDLHPTGNFTVLQHEPAPSDTATVCGFLDRLAEHRPFVYRGAVPHGLRDGLSREQLVALTGDKKVRVSVVDNINHGAGNNDGEVGGRAQQLKSRERCPHRLEPAG